MPHNAARYVEANIIPKGIKTYQLNHLEAVQIEAILQNDAKDYFYSATISTANAYSSIERRHYSWSTVQLYYSNFYILRGLLALKGICIFYDGYKPYSIHAIPSESAQKPSGKQNSTTHGMVLSIAKNRIGASITGNGQTIDQLNPLDWMKDLREEANYKHSKFFEPNAPAHLKTVAAHGIRKAIGSYLADSVYTYDPDHAAVAYNLFLWSLFRDELHKRGKFDFTDDELSYLRSLFADETGPLGNMHKLLTIPA